MNNDKQRTEKIFHIRMTEEIHESIRIAAFNERKSMNAWILMAIQQALGDPPESESTEVPKDFRREARVLSAAGRFQGFVSWLVQSFRAGTANCGKRRIRAEHLP